MLPTLEPATEVVCYLMILMNYNCAMVFIKHETGIFRSTILKAGSTVASAAVPEVVPEEVKKYIKNWNGGFWTVYRRGVHRNQYSSRPT